MTSDSERPQQALAYDLSAERLRATCRFSGIVLLASPILPFEVVESRPVFVWEILGELHPAAALAALAPPVVGLLLLAVWRWVKRPSLLAFVSLLALGSWALVVKLGADAAAWDVGALPESIGQRLVPYAVTIACAGAALRLLAEPAARRASRIVAGASMITGLAFGLWPGEGEAPLQTCLRFVAGLVDLPDFRLVLGYGVILVLAVFPLIAASVAASFALAGGGRHTALVAELVTMGAPGLLLLFALRNVLLTFGDTSVIVLGALAMVCLAVLLLLVRSLELGALWATGLGASSDREQSGRPRRFVAVAGALAALLVALVFVLARPAAKGIDWPLAKRSEKADRLFGELLPKWALSRARWGLAARQAGSAADLAEARAAGNEMMRAAREVDPEVARAVGDLLQGASDLDLAGRRWVHLVEAVNDASRRSRLPYYLDPNVRAGTHGQRLERLFLVYPYRVEGVRPARAGGLDYALLAVRRLGEARDSHDRLGFSRDRQPFALVVLDEIEPYAKELETLAGREPPGCIELTSTNPAYQRCGALLRILKPTAAQVRRLVERHELQHQIDGPALTHSAAVLQALAGYEAAAIHEVNRELSAYTAEFVARGVSPRLALVHTLPFLHAPLGSALYFVVRLQLAALSARPLDDPSGEELLAVFSELAVLPDEDLRSRARAAYEELFDEELPDVDY